MDSLGAMELFAKVVQEGSFSAAARSLSLTPSAISKQIGRLEDRLGARLITRTTRSFALTEEGRAFHDRAVRILAEVAEAEQAVSDLHGEPRGTLRVNAPFAFARQHMAPLLPAFLEKHPDLSIDLTCNDRFVDLVDNGVDMAIRIGELADSSLMARRLARNRRVVVGSPTYLERKGFPKTPDNLTNYNCVVYTYRALRNDWLLVGPDDVEQTVRVSGNMESNYGDTLYKAVLGDLGLALLPLWMVGQDVKSGRLVDALPGYHAPDSAVYAVYPPGRHLSPKVRRFIDYLAESLAEPECGLP